MVGTSHERKTSLRVESRSGAPRGGLGPSVAAPFGGGASSGLNQRTFPDPAHQTGRAVFPHPAFVPKDSCGRPRETRRLPMAAGQLALRLGMPCLLKLPDLLWSLLGLRQSPGLGFFVHRFGTKAPSLHRHYPASSVLRAYPPSPPALSGPRGLQVAAPQGACTGRDFPCCDGSPVANMPSSMPRQTVARRISLGPCGLAAFPMCLLGRRLH